MQQDATEELDAQEPLEGGVEEHSVVSEEAGDGEAGELVVPEEAPELTELEVAQAQVEEWKGVAVRATADLDNFRKRMAREKTDAVVYGNQRLLEELLPVLDNFEMGLQAAAADEDSMIFKGMEMVKRQLDDFLSAQGVEEVPAEGQVFDVNVHEAVAQEESAEVECGAVLRVMRKGYKLKDRLLRPANVVVAKAPSTADEAGEGGGE
jgi:molecular chaperone GrpE